MVLAPDQIDQIVCAQVAFLVQEHVDNLLPLAGALATCRLQSCEIWDGLHGGRPDPSTLPFFDLTL
jgi:hypothetical protein